NTSERHGSTRGSVLKLLAIAAVALTLVSLGLFGLLRSGTETASATVATPTAEANQSRTVATEVSRAAPAQTTMTQPIASSTPEDELKKLREIRMTAKSSDHKGIFQAFAKIETQYPRDYRFPYERAKLAVKGPQDHSHTEAFRALNAAAEKAINTGKANEM